MNETRFIKGFTCFSRQDYFESNHVFEKDIVDRIMIGNYAENGCGCEYEMTMVWVKLDDASTPRLCVFNDAFIAFKEHAKLFDELPRLNDVNFSPDEFSWLLIKLGYKDFSDTKLA